jgi:hypothetical protein
MDAGILVKL